MRGRRPKKACKGSEFSRYKGWWSEGAGRDGAHTRSINCTVKCIQQPYSIQPYLHVLSDIIQQTEEPSAQSNGGWRVDHGQEIEAAQFANV